MDSINFLAVVDFLWMAMIGHMAIGLAWAKIPSLSELYPKTAAAYAAMAMEEYLKARENPDTEAETVELYATLAKNAVERADISLDYHAKQRKFFINMLWVTELRWTFECLRGIERMKA